MNTRNKYVAEISRRIFTIAVSSMLVAGSFCATSLAETDDNDEAGELYIKGEYVDEDNAKGDGWSYDEDSNTLTLNGFKYEGTGIFKDTDSEDEDADDSDEEYDEEDSGDEEEFEDEEDDEEDEEDEDCDEDEDSDEDDSITGVIYCDGEINIVLKGESHITVTDKDSDESSALNVDEDQKYKGDGVLYIKSSEGSKTYGNPPKESENAEAKPEISEDKKSSEPDSEELVEDLGIKESISHKRCSAAKDNGGNDQSITSTNSNDAQNDIVNEEDGTLAAGSGDSKQEIKINTYVDVPEEISDYTSYPANRFLNWSYTEKNTVYQNRDENRESDEDLRVSTTESTAESTAKDDGVFISRVAELDTSKATVTTHDAATESTDDISNTANHRMIIMASIVIVVACSAAIATVIKRRTAGK